MAQLTGNEIWTALEKDAAFMANIPEGRPRDLWREYVDRLPAVLAEQIDKPVTFASLCDAKIAYTKDALKSGYVRRIVEAYPEDAFVFMSTAEMAQLAEDTLGELLPQLAEILEDVPAWLESQGISEDDVIARGTKLQPVLLDRYRQGTLTVADVLREQPAVILKNTD